MIIGASSAGGGGWTFPASRPAARPTSTMYLCQPPVRQGESTIITATGATANRTTPRWLAPNSRRLVVRLSRNRIPLNVSRS